MSKTIKLEKVVSENQDNEFSDSVSRDSYNNLQCQNENLQLLLSISKETCSDQELKLIDFKYQISNLEEQISNLKRENKQSADIIAVRNNIFNNLCDTIQKLDSKNNYSDFYRQFPPPDFNSVNIGCPVAIVPFPPAQLQVNNRIPQDPRNRPSQQLINNPIDSKTSNDINGSSAFQINSNVFDWKNDSSAEGQIALMKLEWKMLEPSSSKAEINLSPSLSLVEDGLENMESYIRKDIYLRLNAKCMPSQISSQNTSDELREALNKIDIYDRTWFPPSAMKLKYDQLLRQERCTEKHRLEEARLRIENRELRNDYNKLLLEIRTGQQIPPISELRSQSTEQNSRSSVMAIIPVHLESEASGRKSNLSNTTAPISKRSNKRKHLNRRKRRQELAQMRAKINCQRLTNE